MIPYLTFIFLLCQDDNKLEGADATSQINKSLIKRFNQHSTLVLKTCDKKRRLDDSNGSQQQQPDESINGTGGKHLTHAESTTTSADEASESSKQVMDACVCVCTRVCCHDSLQP